MKLGKFSLSLAVKNLKESRTFYEKLGFAVIDGKEEQNWLVLQNENTIIGLFQGMFEKNCLSFHPKDVRSLQKELKAKGISFSKEAEDGSGPAHAMLLDPDGNPVLLDQF